MFNYQSAVIVGQIVRGGGSVGGRLRLWVWIDHAMASKEARTCVPQKPALAPTSAVELRAPMQCVIIRAYQRSLKILMPTTHFGEGSALHAKRGSIVLCLFTTIKGRLGWQKTIEPRFCVTTKVTKTAPKCS